FDQGLQLWRSQPPLLLKVGTDAIPQGERLADVDHLAGRVLKEVDSGLGGERSHLLQDPGRLPGRIRTCQPTRPRFSTPSRSQQSTKVYRTLENASSLRLRPASRTPLRN